MPEGVPSPHAIEVVWEGERRYRGGREGGATLLLDGDGKVSPGPVDTLLVSLAACSAIDVVEILEKRRTPPAELSVRVEFSRAPSPPRRLTDVRLHFRVRTTSERQHVERAVELSLEKYCSVSSSLAPDIRTSWEVEIEAASENGSEGS
ncbi:MAG TPA: OsmC family protein [Longimicrobiaceae bacterium]|nr:OsmC family protein [Longimicrobiaceae bacterium]